MGHSLFQDYRVLIKARYCTDLKFKVERYFPNLRGIAIPLAIGFLIGVMTAQQLPALPSVEVIGGLLLVLGVLSYVWFRWRGRGFVCSARRDTATTLTGQKELPALPLALLACFIFGFIWAVVHAMLRLGNDLPLNVQRQNALVEGVILSIPQTFE